ncbi:MAG: hypothetical protein QOJ02_3094 [Acidobacteriota bacterium]|jgi:hypothetical protein|nr:hypothetical protein [Acidobacteriota bacterium]
MDMKKESPFACNMDAIKPDQRQQHLATASQVFHAVESIRELPNGYAFQLPDESEMLQLVTEFISLERLCCPFFGFTLEIEPEGGSVWLQLTGREGVKPFIRAEIGEFLGESLTHRGDFR